MPPPPVPDAGALIAWQQQVKREALAAVARCGSGSGPTDPLPLDVALKVRDASMLCTTYGHSCLAQRGEVLITAKASSYSSTPCTDPACPLTAVGLPSQLSGSAAGSKQQCCFGNRFERGASTSSGSQQQWLLVLPHHKGARRGREGQVLVLCDAQEVALLEIWHLRGRPVVLLQQGEESTEQAYLDDTGAPFTQYTLGVWWTRTHRSVYSRGLGGMLALLYCLLCLPS